MVHIIQSDREVPAGIVGEELRRRGVDQVIVRLYDGERLPPLAAVSAVIILGGAMGANDDDRYPFLTGLKRFLGKAAALEVPCLGICLGGQLLSVAGGGEVTSNACGEKGSCSITLTDEGLRDRLFHGFDRTFRSFQWHNDTFSIPPGGIGLAYTDACRNQAFRAGSMAWGLQFHPEVSGDIVREWSSWTPETAERSGEFVAAFQESEDEYREVSRRLVGNFLEIAGLVS